MTTRVHTRFRTTARLTAAALTVAALTFGPIPTATAIPVEPDTLMAERTNPAVQLIQTRFDATVSLREVDLNASGSELFQSGANKFYTGELRSRSDVAEYFFERLERDPEAYLREVGERRTKKFSQTYRGSGFIASPDGAVVTARHVVSMEPDIKKDFARQGAEAFARSDTKTWATIFADWDLSNDAIESMVSAITTFDSRRAKVKVKAPKVSVILGTADADGSRIGKAYPAEVTYRSSTTLGEDVAVLRMRVDGQLPSLSLAATPVAQGDHIYLNGFPALPDGSRAALLQPTLTGGRITSMKDSGGGLVLPQTDAVGSGGGSGSAAVNDAGEVVGIFVSQAVDQNGASLGQRYLMPLDSVRNALSRAGVTPQVSQTTVLYNTALDHFYADHYSQALGEFRQVKELFPAHAYAGGYITRAQLAIGQGKDVPIVEPEPSSPWSAVGGDLLVVGGLLLVLMLVVGPTVLLLRRRSRPERGDGGSPAIPQGPVPGGPTSEASGSVGDGPAARPLNWPAVVPAGPAVAASSHAEDHATVVAQQQPLTDDFPNPAENADQDVDDIPEWVPLDYIDAFPATETSRRNV